MALLVTSLQLRTNGAVGSSGQARLEPLPPAMRLLPGSEQALVLAGHLTPSEFQALRDFHNPGLSNVDRRALNQSYAATREAQSGLDPVATDRAWLGPLEDPRVEGIVRSPGFANSFGSSEFEFGWVVPHLVVPSQVYVKVNGKEDPGQAPDLFEVAFPQPAQPKFEVIDGAGGIYYLVSSSPHMNAGSPVVNASDGLLTVTVGMHLNFILVAQYGDTVFAVNGTHRLEWATRLRLDRVPALVINARSARQAGVFLGVDGFSITSLVKAARPPLIGDFRTGAALTMPLRKSLYGFTLRTKGLRRA